jgi:hypothetical protein
MAMIAFLARLFRGVHFVLGMSAPPPDQDERKFVLVWLAVLAAFVAIFGGLLYLIPYFYIRH